MNARCRPLGAGGATDIGQRAGSTSNRCLDVGLFATSNPNQSGAAAPFGETEAATTTQPDKRATTSEGYGYPPFLSVMPCGIRLGRATAAGALATATKGSVEIPVGPWKVTPSYAPNQLALNLARDGNLKVGVDFAFDVADLSIDAGADIDRGLIAGSRFVINGVKGLTVSLSAGAAGGTVDNDSAKIVVPVETNIPIPPSPATAGLPMNVKVKFSLIIETALSGSNATLIGTGKYRLSGPIGFANGRCNRRRSPSAEPDQHSPASRSDRAVSSSECRWRCRLA